MSSSPIFDVSNIEFSPVSIEALSLVILIIVFLFAFSEINFAEIENF